MISTGKSQIRVKDNLLLQLTVVLSNDSLQHKRIGDSLRMVWLLLQRLVQGGLCLLCPSQVELCHGLCDKCLD